MISLIIILCVILVAGLIVELAFNSNNSITGEVVTLVNLTQYLKQYQSSSNFEEVN